MTSSTASPILHLVNGDGEFAPENRVKTFFTDISFGKKNGGGGAASNNSNRNSNSSAGQTTKYHTLAVFGGQGTGKSTLLNALFGTKFSTMVEDGGRSQTTRGAFGALIRDAPASPSSSHPASPAVPTAAAAAKKREANLLLVLDFEGTDGLERGEDQSFERKLALFAVSCADVVIINMNCSEVNRFNAANLALLRTVFELNLRLFQSRQQSPAPNKRPTLFFLIRDFVSGSLDKNSEVLTASLGKVWSNVAKPEEFRRATLQDFFELRFACLPHYVLQRERFDMEVAMLRGAFLEFADENHDDDDEEKNNNNSTGSSSATSEMSLTASTGLIMNADVRYVFEQRPTCTTGIPLVDNVTYLSNVWETIKAQRDLDIPSQRLLVATLRAQEARQEILAAFHREMRRIAEQLDAGVVPRGLAARLETLNLTSAVAFRDQMMLYIDGSSDLVENALAEMAVAMQRATENVFMQLAQCLAKALLRSNEAVVQLIVDRAVGIELPKLAERYLNQMQMAGKIAGAKNDRENSDGSNSNTNSSSTASAAANNSSTMATPPTETALEAVRRQQLFDEQLGRVDASPLVRSFWAFVVAEIDSVVNDIRGKIEKFDVAAEQQKQQQLAAANNGNNRGDEAAILVLSADGSSNRNNGGVSTSVIVREIALAFHTDRTAVALVLDFLASGLEERVRQRARAMTADIVGTINGQFDKTMQTNPETGGPRVFRNKEALDAAHRQAQSEGYLLLNCLAMMRGRFYSSTMLLQQQSGGNNNNNNNNKNNSDLVVPDSPTKSQQQQASEETMRTKMVQLMEKFDITYVPNGHAVAALVSSSSLATASGASNSTATNTTASSSSSSSADSSKHSIIRDFIFPSSSLLLSSSSNTTTSAAGSNNSGGDDETAASAKRRRERDQEDSHRAVRIFTEHFLLLDETAFRRAFDLFQRDCSFKRLFQLRQLDTHAAGGAHWAVYMVLAFFVVREAFAWLRDPVWFLLISLFVGIFLRQKVAEIWEEFVESGPSQIVIPLKLAIDKVKEVVISK